MVVEHGRHIGRRHRLRQRREADDVGEHHRQLGLARIGHRPAGHADQPAHQLMRHIGLEPSQRLDHLVEGARLLVDLADARAFQRLDRIQLEPLDLAGGGRYGAHRPGDAPGQQQGRRQRHDEHADADGNGADQPPYLLAHRLDRDMHADPPRHVAIGGRGARQDQVAGLAAAGFAHVDVVPAVEADDIGIGKPGQHRIADLADREHRLVGRQQLLMRAVEHRRMRQNAVVAIEHEHRPVPLREPADEARQGRQRDACGDRSNGLATLRQA